MAAAESQFRLGVTDKDGFSLREILEGLLERTKRPERRAEIEAELTGTPFPAGFIYLWAIFNRLRSQKGSNGFARDPVNGLDIESYERRHRFPLAPWEHAILEDLNTIDMRVQGESSREQSRSGESE